MASAVPPSAAPPSAAKRPGAPAPTRAPKDAGAPFEQLAGDLHRLSVLLAAGLDPLAAIRAAAERGSVWEAAGVCGSPGEVPAALLRGSDGGSAARARGMVAATWAVAIETGAPLAATLERAADDLRAHADAERQVDIALAGPLATARTVALLPLAGVGLGLLLGVDPFGVVLGTIPGAVAAVLGIALLVAGVRWNRRMAAAARTRDPHAGVGAELLALALAGGGTPEAALALVRRVAAECGIPTAVDEAESALAFAQRAGVPASALLRAEAARARRVALADGLRAAAALGTRLLAPLALCFLPAFVLLGVVPLLIGILRGVLSGF